MKTMRILLPLFTVAALLLAVGCGDQNQQATFDPVTGHPGDWINKHGSVFVSDPSLCVDCHGADLGGGISALGCFAASFNGIACHGTLAMHGTGWSDPDAHGAATKAAPDTFTGFASCKVCHGADYDGGIIQTSCASAPCHAVSSGVVVPHSPPPWRGSPRTHTDTNQQNAAVCGECHRDESGAGIPLTTPSGCFNNTLCHGVVGHSSPFADPAVHGPPAKADLTSCQVCHATPSDGGPGSDPRFNVPLGSLSAGCESTGCHDPLTAHPVPWLGPDSTSHQSAGNLAVACALCHGATLQGGVGPACSDCHTAGSPLTATNCTSCHGNPPAGNTPPDREGAHSEHNVLPEVSAVCDTCHTGAGSGTSSHFNSTVDVDIDSAYDANSGPASFSSGTCSSVSCHGAQETRDWSTGSINVNTECEICHRDQNVANEFNSYFSGEHTMHINGEGALCTECHDTGKLSNVHFNDLATPAMNEAGQTMLDALNYNQTLKTCTVTCHGENHSNRSW